MSLVLLLVVTITGASAMRVTSSQERSTAAQRLKMISLMAAEAGASKTAAAYTGAAGWQNSLPQSVGGAEQVGDGAGYWYLVSVSGATAEVVGEARTGSTTLATSRIRIVLAYSGGQSSVTSWREIAD